MLLCPWDFPDKNTGVGSHFLLQGIFLTQELNPSLLHLYCLNHQGLNHKLYFFFFKQDYQGLCGRIWNELHWRERSLEIRPRAWFSSHLQMGIWESLDITRVPTKNKKNPKTESQRTRQASSHKASKTALDILRHRTYQNRVCEIPSIC